MICPYCGHTETGVLESRDSEDSTRRRRECEKCRKRFTTYERVETIDLTIIKKDGRREKFDRNKLHNGIEKACHKRPVSVEQVDGIVAEIERELRGMEETEIQSSEVGKLVMEKLKKIDKVAYVRYASIYKEFKDAKEFTREVEKLKAEK
ncbi:TPA: transcriptional repressor NrdR [Candidatus Micrarchaeota archaeon]|nr:transcriptional repressor NrdR [Candidatus Micrarchaeota archaeon]